MQRLSAFCVRSKVFLAKTKLTTIQFPIFREILHSKSFQFSRSNHGTKRVFAGPGLNEFLLNRQNGKVESAGEAGADENVPYINEMDLDALNQKVFLEIYGCQMNVNDSEIILSILQKSGYQRTEDINEADVVLIVTCSIRESAETKIWNRLKGLKAFKIQMKKKNMKVGVLGCMAERIKAKMLEIDKTVDFVAGPDSYKDLPRLLAVTHNNQKAVNVLLSLDETYADVMPVRLDQNAVTAFVSIMRGCDNMCTYCIVPFTRGRERSRPIDSILEEVQLLSEQGVKQVTLLGQNVNSYRDITSVSSSFGTGEPTKMVEGFKSVYKPKLGGIRFDTLLDKVSEVNPEMRIRFTSPHPKDFPEEVLNVIQKRKNICCSLHLPAQSGSNAVLERMRRGYTREAYINLVEVIRSKLPNVTLTTDIITGFCGETEKDHEDTLDLIRLIQYNFIYYFPFSMREKTSAYRRYQDDVPAEVKSRRMNEILEEFRRISKRLNEAQINKTQLILVEGFSKKSRDFLAGRNEGNIKVIIPDCSIPNSVDSSETRPIKSGDYVAVLIKEATSQTLKGEPLFHSTLTDFDEFRICRGRQRI